MSFKVNDLMLQVVPQQAPGFNPAILANPVDPLFKQYANNTCTVCTGCTQCSCSVCTACTPTPCPACSGGTCSLCSVCTLTTNGVPRSAACQADSLVGAVDLLMNGEGLETLQRQMKLELMQADKPREYLAFAN